MIRIIVEGPQGAGKSTIIGILADELAARGFGVLFEEGTERAEGEPGDRVIFEERQT